MIILGIDPGLQHTGWGVIDHDGHRLRFVACGHVDTDAAWPLYARLLALDDGISDVVARFRPDQAAIEETFMNRNPAAALKLGQARGVALTAAARGRIPVFEYPANTIKKSLVGAGHAAKDQIAHMVNILLPHSTARTADEADALAVAITHAHHAPPHAMSQAQMPVHRAFLSRPKPIK